MRIRSSFWRIGGGRGWISSDVPRLTVMSHLTNEAAETTGVTSMEPHAAPREISATLGQSPPPRLCVLGPTMLDGLTLTGSQRVVMAALALHRHRDLDVDALVDHVWPDDPPRTARASLHNQISRIRSRFGDDVIATGTGGYRLAVVTDVETIERQASPLLHESCHPDQEPALREALAHWRGRAYEDLVHDVVAESVRVRVEELRLRIEERLAECRVESGDPDLVVGDLEAMVEAEPFRERRWELLIATLARAGRRSEALLAYERCAARLHEELGTEPSGRIESLRLALVASSGPTGRTGSATARTHAAHRHHRRCSPRYRHR